MNLDWKRLKAVVLESDDWGLCAWSPDRPGVPRARRTFRCSAAGRPTLRRLDARARFRRQAHGRRCSWSSAAATASRRCWQANTVMAAPDYARLNPPAFECDELPLIDLPLTPSRWARPGLWGEIVAAREAGVWWPELHGLHHLPECAWLRALRTGVLDARRAFEQQSPVCEAVASSGEYDPREPLEVRIRNLEGAVQRFRAAVRPAPGIVLPARLPCRRAHRGGGRTARHPHVAGPPGARRRRMAKAAAFPRPLPLSRRGGRALLPAAAHRVRTRRGRGERAVVGLEGALRGVRAAWSRSQPAIVSTHRVNYVQLDEARGAEGVDAARVPGRAGELTARCS